MAHDYSSFDYKIINENIKHLLTSRSLLDNTVQVSMPFVKATTTLQKPEILGGAGHRGFTIGLHAIDQDLRYEDIFSGKNGTAPLIGYTYAENGKTVPVYAYEPTGLNILSKLYDKNYLQDTSKFVTIPPPGVTQVVIGRNKSGLLAHAELTVHVPSLIQLESLHRTFLVPGIGMVVEWGQVFSPHGNASQLDNIPKMFPWNNRAELESITSLLAANKYSLNKILEEYVYPSNGQYMWMFGRVANFHVKSNSDGSFTCIVKVVGPSEDSWAYSTRTTVVPPTDASNNLCQDDIHSVYTYFTNEVVGANNFKSLLEKIISQEIPELAEWNKHVLRLRIPNGKENSSPTNENPGDPNISQTTFADSKDAFLFSWRFFVNVVLNDETYGVKGLFKKAGLNTEKIALLLPYADGPARENTVSDILGQYTYIDDPMESFVGMNVHLRSVDPSTMIIVNDQAARLAATSPKYTEEDREQLSLKDFTELSKPFFDRGLFEQSATKAAINANNNSLARDRGFLSTGVWLNHKAVVQSMINANTVLRGIVNLLDRMNAATMNYWNLTVDVAEPFGNDNPNPYNYIVVDANFRENSNLAVDKFIDNVYLFNKYIKRSPEGALVGSELTNCAVDLSLPKRLFSQIATLGLVQPQDLVNAGINVIDKPEKNWKVSDPNDTFREIFSITSITNNDPDEPNPDFTILKSQTTEEYLQRGCNSTTYGQLPAETAGYGYASINSSVIENNLRTGGLTADALEKKINSNKKKYLDRDACKKCYNCKRAEVSGSTAVGESGVPQVVQSGLPWSAAFVSYVMKISNVPFPAQGSHTGYAQSLRTNPSGWEVLNPANTRLQVGDIIVSNREGNNKEFTSPDWQAPINSRGQSPSHGDIVVRLEGSTYAANSNEIASGEAIAIGGNLSQKVGQAKYSILNSTLLQGSDAFVILRPPSGFANKIVTVANGELARWKSWTENNPAAYDTLKVYYQAGGLTPPPKFSSNDPRKNVTCTDDEYYNIGGSVPFEVESSGGSVDNTGETFEALVRNGKNFCVSCYRAQVENRVAGKLKDERVQVEKFTNTFKLYKQVFRYLEVFPDEMVAKITGTADGVLANAFGASPGALSIAADLTLPGINGIRVGELFWIDRIPAFYKAFGAFQVLSIEDTITTDGWQTKIHSRFNYLGRKWRDRMYERLGILNDTN